MTIIRSLFIIIFLLAAPLTTFSEDHVFRDNFPNGMPELRWNFFPFFNRDNLVGAKDSEAPDGDNGTGILDNANAGGFASLSYAVTQQLENFYVEAMIYCPVTPGNKGPLSGIAFLIDPINGNFYRLVCDFKSNDPTLNLAYVGRKTSNYPVYLQFWNTNQIPGGVPDKSGWNTMAVRVKNKYATAYWNGKELPGGPVLVGEIPKGFVGIYTNFVGGLGQASTRVDNFMVKKE